VRGSRPKSEKSARTSVLVMTDLLRGDGVWQWYRPGDSMTASGDTLAAQTDQGRDLTVFPGLDGQQGAVEHGMNAKPK